MKDIITELVDVILRKVQENPHHPPSPGGLRKWLRGQGYAQNDIDAAMRLAVSKATEANKGVDHMLPAARIYTLAEELKMSKDAREALKRLELYALIDAYEIEAILERMYQFEGEVGLEELDYLVNWVVCGARDVETQRTIYDVLDKEPQTYH